MNNMLDDIILNIIINYHYSIKIKILQNTKNSPIFINNNYQNNKKVCNTKQNNN